MTIAAAASTGLAACAVSIQRRELLLVEKPLLVALLAALVHRLRFGPRPHTAANQSKALAARSIDGNHRVQQEAATDALTDQPQTAAVAFRRPKVDFAGVLDG